MVLLARRCDNWYGLLAVVPAPITPMQRALLAGVAGMTAGVVKELGDLENLWPPPYLCRPSGCDFEWMDLAADLAGVYVFSNFYSNFRIWLISGKL